MKKAQKLPNFLQPCLPSYNISQLNIHKDKNLIITAILNTAKDDAMRWLYKTYRKKDIEEVIKKTKRGVWHKDTLDYWKEILGIELNKKTYNNAIIKI